MREYISRGLAVFRLPQRHYLVSYIILIIRYQHDMATTPLDTGDLMERPFQHPEAGHTISTQPIIVC